MKDLEFPCEQEIESKVLTQNRLSFEEMENKIVNANVAALNKKRRLGMTMSCEGEFDIKAWFKSVKGIATDYCNKSHTQNNYLNLNDETVEFEGDVEAEEHEREFSKIDNLDFLNEDSSDAFLSLTNGQKMNKATFVWNQHLIVLTSVTI